MKATYILLFIVLTGFISCKEQVKNRNIETTSDTALIGNTIASWGAREVSGTTIRNHLIDFIFSGKDDISFLKTYKEIQGFVINDCYTLCTYQHNHDYVLIFGKELWHGNLNTGFKVLDTIEIKNVLEDAYFPCFQCHNLNDSTNEVVALVRACAINGCLPVTKAWYVDFEKEKFIKCTNLKYISCYEEDNSDYEDD